MEPPVSQTPSKSTMPNTEVTQQSLFDFNPKALNLQILAVYGVGGVPAKLCSDPVVKENAAEQSSGEGGLFCLSCNLKLDSVTQQHTHYKTDWHCFNLKLKLAGLPPVSREEFMDVIAAGDLSSDESGREGATEDDDDGDDSDGARSPVGSDGEEFAEWKPLHKSPKITFLLSNQWLCSVWRHVMGLPSDLTPDTEVAFYTQELLQLSRRRVWAVLMCSGGYFAGGVFDGNKLLKHKTLHRYTTRKKQGGTQSTRDQKNAPKSAGASLRRYNETRLREEIRDLLNEWKGELTRCDRIFLATPGNNVYFIVRDTCLAKTDPRIRSTPFTTHKPTLVEVKRIHSILSTVEFSTPPVEDLTAEQPVTEPVARATPSSEPVAPVVDLKLQAVHDGNLAELKRLISENYVSPVPRDAMDVMTPLFLACQLDLAPFVQYLLSLSPVPGLDIPVPAQFFRTPLHAAALNGSLELLKALLVAGANPLLKSKDGKTCYDVGSKTARTAIAKYAGKHPEQWNWSAGSIPMLAADQEKKNAEKRRQKRKGQHERAKQRKAQDIEDEKRRQVERLAEEKRLKEQRELEEVERKRQLQSKSLSERERRAMAAEARLGAGPQCDFCKKAITSVPFTRFEFKYCATKCVQEHRVILKK